MSTPTTATATLPHYAAGYPFNHQSAYRQTRLGPSSVPSPSSSYAAPYSPVPAYPNGVYLAASTAVNSSSAASNHSRSTIYPPEAATTFSPDYASSYHANGTAATPTASTAEAAMHAVMATHSTQSQTSGGSHPPRKRRRSGPPDWDSFYKNGLPQEVIVIEDSPEADAQLAQLRTTTGPSYGNGDGQGSADRSGDRSVGGTTIYHRYDPLSQPADGGHSAKKRRRYDDALSTSSTLVAAATRHDAIHSYAQSSGSTISSERTNSNSYTATTTTAANTAATSLASTTGTYDYDASVAGQKRKRITRQQIANDAKKRDRELNALGGSLMHYHPPPLPPIKAPEVDVKVIHDSHYNKNVKVDDDDGHYIVVPDADLTDRYQMVKLLGQGTFGKVVQARDRRKNKLVAIKIIRSVQKYRDASRIELRVLETLKANDRENRNRCIHLFECFDFRGHICIVMDLLGQSVFDFLKGNNFVPFPNSHIQNFARQLLTSVAFLHDLQLIHTDLKPENILLVDANYQTFTYNRKIPSSSTTVARQSSQRKVLLDTEIRLIDFGSATFQDEYHSSVVSTRHYRAPEIILGLGWSFPCDIWSIGCILVEFFTGDALFQTHDNLEHLAMMEAVCDSRIDTHLVQQVSKSNQHRVNPAAKYFKRSRLNYPSPETTRASRRFVKAMKKLNDIIPVPHNNSFMKLFLDLLKRIFVYDPSKRITAKEALQHPWFQEIPMLDDGTEAAKIRLQRARERVEAGLKTRAR